MELCLQGRGLYVRTYVRSSGSSSYIVDNLWRRTYVQLHKGIYFLHGRTKLHAWNCNYSIGCMWELEPGQKKSQKKFWKNQEFFFKGLRFHVLKRQLILLCNLFFSSWNWPFIDGLFEHGGKCHGKQAIFLCIFWNFWPGNTIYRTRIVYYILRMMKCSS